MGESRSVSCFLEPLGLFDRILATHGGLDVDGLRDVRVDGFSDVVLRDVVPFSEFLYLPPESWMGNPGLPMSVEEFWVVHVIEVDMSVNEIQLGHRNSPRMSTATSLVSSYTGCQLTLLDTAGYHRSENP